MSFSIYFRENVSPSLFLLIYGLIILFSFYLIIIIINFFIKHSRHVEYLSKLPGLKTWDPITGNVFPFIVKYLNGNLESSQFIVAQMDEWFEQFKKEKIMSIWRGFDGPYVITFSAKHVEPLLNSNINIDKGKEYELTHPLVGLGLLTNFNEKWRQRRKLLTPAFHFRILQDFFPIIKEHAIKFSEKFSGDHGLGCEIDDIFHPVTRLTLSVICETAMGHKIDCSQETDYNYVQSLERITKVISERMFIPWYWNDTIFYLTPTGRQFKKDLEIINGFTDLVINKKKMDFIKNRNGFHKKIDLNENIYSNNSSKNRLAFLDILMDTHFTHPNYLSELEMRWEVNTFMFAGEDTISSAITFTLYLIGLHQHVQEKVYQEISDVHKSEDDISMNSLKEMKYLEWVIKESLRLYPPAPNVFRKLTTDLNTGSYLIPRGATFFMSIYHIHRDPDEYSDPESFIPERWATNPSFYSFIPFSAGPRNCIGQKFAMLELKTVLAYIIKKYKFTSLVPRNEMKLGIEIVLRPKTDVKMEFIAR